jgi:hypothetical protein
MCEASPITRFRTDCDLGHAVVGLFSLPFQLPLASVGKLLPGFSHLLELLAVSGRSGSRHLPAFGGMQKVLVDFLQAEVPTNLLSNGAGEDFLCPAATKHA